VSRTLIIAEAGVNHGGDLSVARDMVRAAAAAGADLVKFQTFDANESISRFAPKAEYQKKATGEDESQLDMVRQLELSRADHEALLEECRQAGIGFFSTGFDFASIDLLVELGADRIKVPSGEITNLPLLRHIAAKRLPVILSTGMSDMAEIEQALEVLETGGVPRTRITVLHCNTEYPTPLEDVNLRAMNAIGSAFGVAVGYSDHTLGIDVAVAAVALGACVIEKHFTLSRSLPGPDHQASLEPDELAAMVRAIRNVEIALSGSGVKEVAASERKNRAIARKSIVARRAIAQGEVFAPDNLATKRPGTGISPMRWDDVIGQAAPRAFAPDEAIEL
jgi:N-acetylneuraminate synthase